MGTSDLINLIAAILVGGGTITLAVMTWKSIRQTRDIQKDEKRQRLLNEIIEWAVDVTKGELLMEFADVRGIKDIRWSRLYLYTTVDKLQFSFRQARTRGLYISGTVSILGADLQQAVGELIRNLEVHIQALKECIDAIDSPACETTLDGATSAARKTTDSKKLLDESATKVLEEATKIMTKDVGGKEENMSQEGDEVTESNEITLKNIEEHLKRQDRQTEWQWLCNLGVSVMAVGLTWFIATITQGILDFNSLFVFFIGVSIGVLSLFYRYRKKS